MGRQINGLNRLAYRLGLFVLLYYPTVTLFNALTIWSYLAFEYGLGYWIIYFLPKILPFYPIAAYFGLRNGNHKTLKNMADLAAWFLVVAIVVFALFSITSFVSNGFLAVASLGNHNVFDWSYAALTEYPVGFLLAYLLMQRKTGDVLESVTFATVLVMFAGLFYELPLYTLKLFSQTIDSSYPFILCTNIVCGFFMFYFLYIHKWRPEKWFFLALVVFGLHACWWRWWYANPSLNWYYTLSVSYVPTVSFVLGWVPRIVGLAVLLSLIYGFKKGDRMELDERRKGV